jgi:hypothetical protein
MKIRRLLASSYFSVQVLTTEDNESSPNLNTHTAHYIMHEHVMLPDIYT